MIDVVGAVMAILNADTQVSTLTQGRVYDTEIPEAQDSLMSQKLVVVRFAGGPGTPLTLQISDRRVNLLCYGETPHLAQTVYYASEEALNNVGHTIRASTYIHWCNLSTGPIPLRDADVQWPYVVSSWMVRASDLTMS